MTIALETAKSGGGITWAGPGRTAFAVPVALGASRVPRECESAAGIAECLGAGADSPRAQALRDFFASAGDRAVGTFVLSDERLYDASWIGEDAGPGSRTGVHALAELDDVGVIVVCAPDSSSGLARREEAVVDLAARRHDQLFLLERSGGGGSARSGQTVEFIFPNVAVVDARRTSIGSVAGYLEASDWRDHVAYRTASLEMPTGLAAEGAATLEAWRRRAGLRRSIDLGTRWMVFELSHPLLWKGVERDVSAFLHRLEKLGFFTGLDFRARDCEVECGPCDDSVAEDPDASRLRISLRVRKKTPESERGIGWSDSLSNGWKHGWR